MSTRNIQAIVLGLQYNNNRRLQRNEEEAGGIGGVDQQFINGVLIVVGTLLEDLFNSTYGAGLFSELVPDIEFLGDFYFQISGQALRVGSNAIGVSDGGESIAGIAAIRLDSVENSHGHFCCQS